MALRGLAHNNFCTFFGKENKCGTPVAKFCKKFKDANTPGFHPTMLLEEGFCPRNSNSGLQHTRNYNLALMAALMYTKKVNSAKYSAVLKEHTKEPQPEPRLCPPSNEDSNSNASPQKRTKATATKGSFAESFYHFLLGKHTSTTTDAIVMWLPKEELHEVLGATIISAGSVFDTQQTVIRQNWDDGLMSTLSNIYTHVPIFTTTITRVFMKKLQQCSFSTAAPFQESPSTISLACFTPVQQQHVIRRHSPSNRLKWMFNSTRRPSTAVPSVVPCKRTIWSTPSTMQSKL